MKYLILISIFFISSCAQSNIAQNGLTPMPQNKELDNDAVKAAMNIYLKQQDSPANSAYDIARVDIDGDNRRDALVLIKLPYTYWCDWGGCPLIIFKDNRTKFKFISRTENVRGPLFVAKSRSNGWRDIIVRASGTNTRDRNVKLSFNGIIYPKNSLGAPTYNSQPSSYNMDKFFR